jgi:hypothetical protein
MLESLYKFPFLINHRLLLLLELKHIVVQLWWRVAIIHGLRELETSSLLEAPNLFLDTLLLQGWINVSLLLWRSPRLRHHGAFREARSACLLLLLLLLLITVTEYFG